MSIKWVRRRAHVRRLSSGDSVQVAPSWVPMEDKGGDAKGASFHSACPVCDAPILSLRMPNGGWVHFERGIGLSRLKASLFLYRRRTSPMYGMKRPATCLAMPEKEIAQTACVCAILAAPQEGGRQGSSLVRPSLP